MRILLTGANGFTGQHFSKIATEAGHEVIPLQSDITDSKELETEILLIQPEYVLHLAGISFVGHKKIEEFYKVNVIGTTNLLHALTQTNTKPKSIILASSATVYGNCNSSPISETEPPSPTSHYAMSKLAMEYMANNFKSELPIIIARPFNYTGYGQSKDFIVPKLIYHFLNKKEEIELGNIHVEREFNDILFICKIYLELLNYGKSGETYNLCTGITHSIKELIDILINLTNHKIKININQNLIRENEIPKLSGNSDKLVNLLLRNQIYFSQSKINNLIFDLLIQHQK